MLCSHTPLPSSSVLLKLLPNHQLFYPKLQCSQIALLTVPWDSGGFRPAATRVRQETCKQWKSTYELQFALLRLITINLSCSTFLYNFVYLTICATLNTRSAHASIHPGETTTNIIEELKKSPANYIITRTYRRKLLAKTDTDRSLDLQPQEIID